MFARVISAIVLPLPEGFVSYTAVRVLTRDGEQAFFFKDTPLAPTLQKGDWIEFKRTAAIGVDIPVLPSAGLRVLPPAELNISRSDREAQLTTRLSLLDKTADTRSPEFQAEVKELLAKLKMTRKDFRVGYSSEPDAIPDDLLIEILPPSLQDLARTTIVEMYR